MAIDLWTGQWTYTTYIIDSPAKKVSLDALKQLFLSLRLALMDEITRPCQ